jgi:hypothetical protein
LVKELDAGGTPVILTTWEDELGRIMVGGQPRQIALETSIFKN